MMDLELGHTRLILEKCVYYGALRNQAAYILATAKWETAHTMQPVKEAYWLSEGWRLANLRYSPWYGRGFVQLTWEDNYKRAGRELNRDLTTDPDVVMEPEISAEILVLGSMQGWFTGKKIPDYITLSRSDFRGARRVINGMDKASAIAELAVDYDRALLADGYGVEPTLPDVEAPTPPNPEDATIEKPISQSTTIWSSVGGIATAVVGTLADLDPIVQGVLVLAAIGFGIWIIRERIIHRR